MKLVSVKNYIAIAFFLLGIISVSAQAPQRMGYQSIVRNATGELVANATVGVKVSVIKDAETGTVVYEETFVGSTNENGLLTLEIGGGVPLTGTFSGIDWGNGIYFVKTETDPNGGTNYSITGIGQLLSVPYSFYAANSSNQGKTTIILTGDITDTEAAAQIDRELGYNTENIIIDETTQLTTVDFTGATNLISVSITDNAQLTLVNFSTLTSVYKEVFIIGNPALSNINFPLLKKMSGLDMALNNNPSITNISFPVLEKLDNTVLSINDNVALTQINLPEVKKMRGLNLNGNSALTSFSAPQVTAIRGNVYIGTNPNISTFNLNALQTAGDLIISLTSLTSISFPLLSAVSSSVAIDAGLSLQSLNLPLLNNTPLSISNCPLLTSLTISNYISGSFVVNETGLSVISLPNFTNARNITCINNPVLTSINLQGIQTVSQNITFTNNPMLTSITFPDAVDFSLESNQPQIQLQNNALTTATVNNILQKMVTALPLSNKIIFLNGQTPPAPPTGQGLIDKQFLIDNFNTVNTD
jgi:hypothetical protein